MGGIGDKGKAQKRPSLDLFEILLLFERMDTRMWDNGSEEGVNHDMVHVVNCVIVAIAEGEMTGVSIDDEVNQLIGDDDEVQRSERTSLKNYMSGVGTSSVIDVQNSIIWMVWMGSHGSTDAWEETP